jgi:hypothetical protein
MHTAVLCGCPRQLHITTSFSSPVTVYSNYYTDAASVPPMRFTDNPSSHIFPTNNLQIGSIKIASVRGGLQWPIDVFGMVTVCDILDDCKNIIYARARSNCETITEEVILYIFLSRILCFMFRWQHVPMQHHC